MTLGDLLTPKEQPQGSSQQVKSEVSTPKLEPLPTDVKDEGEEFDAPGRSPDALHETMTGVAENHPHDSEDSLSQEHVASELRQLHELRGDTLPETSPPEEPLLQVLKTQQIPCLITTDQELLLQMLRNIGRTMKPMHREDRTDSAGDYKHQIHTCSIPRFG